jgi:hypothetical protein
MQDFAGVTLAGFLGSGIATAIVGAILGAVLQRRNKVVEAEIKSHFDAKFKVFESTRTWKQQALYELFGPLQMQFVRTRRAFDRWNGQDLYLEGSVIRNGNMTIRDLLLSKGHLIPPELMKDANDLVEHYDAWLEEFERVRGEAGGNLSIAFVFAGPQGYPFPGAAEERFKSTFKRLQIELYGV